jgi:hypothetical protein
MEDVFVPYILVEEFRENFESPGWDAEALLRSVRRIRNLRGPDRSGRAVPVDIGGWYDSSVQNPRPKF